MGKPSEYQHQCHKTTPFTSHANPAYPSGAYLTFSYNHWDMCQLEEILIFVLENERHQLDNNIYNIEQTARWSKFESHSTIWRLALYCKNRYMNTVLKKMTATSLFLPSKVLNNRSLPNLQTINDRHVEKLAPRILQEYLFLWNSLELCLKNVGARTYPYKDNNNILRKEERPGHHIQ